MAFEEEILQFAKEIPAKLEHIDTEETTKIALITPFLRLMGYDTTNPAEVRAEYTADVGTKKGEKVDFAILENGEPIIFIECKPATNDLNVDNISQLFRYVAITDVQIGLLTNGLEYKFFTTGDDNKMDEKPFLDIDILNLTKKDIKELEKFAKPNFNVDEVVSRADNLKYRNLIKKTLLSEFEEPSEEFVIAIARQVYDGILTPNVKERFATLIAVATNEIINEKINKSLNDAIANNEEEQKGKIEEDVEIDDGIITTKMEKEAYLVIKSIASEVIDVNRVALRDRKHYCNILFDDNQRYPIVRLYFNNPEHLRVEFYDEITLTKNGGKKGEKVDINDISDFYNYKNRIIDVIKQYLDM